MTRAQFPHILLALTMATVVLEAQQTPAPAGTWTTARPVVEKWDAEFVAAGRTVAAADKISADIRSFLIERASDVWAYEAAMVGYNRLNRNPLALDVVRQYLARFPNETALDARVVEFFGIWGSVTDLEALPDRWHAQKAYWSALLQAAVRQKAAPEKIERAGLEYLSRLPVSQDTDGGERIRVAEMWMQSGVNPRSAELVAREAVEHSERSRPELSVSDAEQLLILGRLLIVRVTRSTLGWALYQQDRFNEALVELQRAADIAERDKLTTRRIFFRLGQTLEKLGRPDQALDAYFKELAWGDAVAPTSAAIVDLYRRHHGSTDDLETTQRTRINELVAQRLETAKDLVRDTDEPIGRFDIKRADGGSVDLQQYKGKVVIIEFWATWCGPCRASLKHTDELLRSSPLDIVVIAPALDAESGHAAAAAFLKQMKYDFVLAWDDPKRRAISLPFIPARLLLDRTGRLKLVEFGYTLPGAQLFQQRLEAMLKTTNERTR